MPHYRLTIENDSDDTVEVVTIPFRAISDELAVADMRAYIAGIRQRFGDTVKRWYVDTLDIGPYNAKTGEIETRTDIRLFDSAEEDRIETTDYSKSWEPPVALPPIVSPLSRDPQRGPYGFPLMPN